MQEVDLCKYLFFSLSQGLCISAVIEKTKLKSKQQERSKTPKHQNERARELQLLCLSLRVKTISC